MLVLRVHCVFRQRLQMFPAAQRTEAADIRTIMDREIAAVALAIDGSFGMGRTQLAPRRDGFPVRADQPLRDVKAAAVAFRYAEHRGQVCHRGPQPVRMRTVVAQRVVEIALHEAAADRPGGGIQPDVPRVAGNENFRKSNQFRAIGRRLRDQTDAFVDGGIKIEPDRRRLNHRDPVLRMSKPHRCLQRFCIDCRISPLHPRRIAIAALDRNGRKIRLARLSSRDAGDANAFYDRQRSRHHTSFQRHVLTQRLDQCARELASPRTVHRQIGEIAFAWGFNDLSHFGRVFREHYGLSPRDWRQSKLAS